jgi:hypothetical protein
MNIQKEFFFIYIFFLLVTTVYSQIVDKSKSATIHSSPAYISFYLDGYVDSYNSYSHDYALGAKRVFEPLKSIKILNKGKTTINKPRLLANSYKNWYDIQSHKNELFIDVTDNREKAFLIWKHFTDNRIHWSSADKYSHVSDPIKLLGYRGYLTCGYASALITSYGKTLGFEGRTWHMSTINDITHAVPELKIDDRFVILDVDTQTFYLDYDNESLVGKEELCSDKYLIHRTHHYGRSRLIDLDIASLYFGNVYGGFGSNYSGHTLDVILRPGESIEFDWSDAKLLHHIRTKRPNPIPWHISNSSMQYVPPFDSVDMNVLFADTSNLKVDSQENDEKFLSHQETGKHTDFIVDVNVPYPILSASLNFDFISNGEDYVSVDFSLDGVNWDELYKSNSKTRINEAVFIGEKFKIKTSSEIHKYYLRFELEPTLSNNEIRIYNILSETKFQVSKYFMPNVRLGDNLIEYYDDSVESNKHLEVKIKWSENFSNSPPHKVEESIFPENNSTTENTFFTFEWGEPPDEENDAIVDYEFILSKYDDFRYPLSANFHRYISVLHDTLQPKFSIPYHGLLNAGTIYYWKVRAKDSTGVWGNWSDVWKFTAGGVMHPLNGTLTENDNEINLFWEDNILGEKPFKYNIYGSNDDQGFIPNDRNLIGESNEQYFYFENNGLDYFRVAAVDESGNLSGPSKVFSDVATSIDDEKYPESFVLEQNYPNPFNPATTISFTIPQSNQDAAVIRNVKLSIYNILGQEIATLINDQKAPGKYRVTFNAESIDYKLSSGAYIYVLTYGNKKLSKKMLYLK